MPSPSSSSPLTQSKIYYSAPTFEHSSPTTGGLPPISFDNKSKRHQNQPNTARNQQTEKRQFSVFGTDNGPKSSRLVVERLRHDKTKDISQIVAAGDIYHKGRAKPTTPRRRNHIDNQFDIKDKKSMRDELLPDAEFVKRIFYTMANRQGGAIDVGQFEEAACVVFGRVNGVDLDMIPAPARDAHGLLMERIPNQKKMTLENFHVSLVSAGYFLLMKPLFTIRQFATAKEFEFLAKNLGIENPGDALKELDPQSTGKFSLRDFVWWAANRTCEGDFVLDLLPMKALSVSSPRSTHSGDNPSSTKVDPDSTAGRCAVSPRLADILAEKEKLRGGGGNNTATMKNTNNFSLENEENKTTSSPHQLPSIHAKNSSVSPQQQQNRGNIVETPRTSDSLSSNTKDNKNNNTNRRVVARRGKMANNNKGANKNDDDDEDNKQNNHHGDDGFSFDGTLDEDQRKVRQAMKDSIQDSEVSTTPSAMPEKIDQATSISFPSPPKEQNTRRFPRQRGGGGGGVQQQRTYPIPKSHTENNTNTKDNNHEEDQQVDPHSLTQPVIHNNNNHAHFANSDSIFDHPQGGSGISTDGGYDQHFHHVEHHKEESFHPIYNHNNPNHHNTRDIKQLGVISTKKSIHGNKLIVNTTAQTGAHHHQQHQHQHQHPGHRSNSLTPHHHHHHQHHHSNAHRENSISSSVHEGNNSHTTNQHHHNVQQHHDGNEPSSGERLSSRNDTSRNGNQQQHHGANNNNNNKKTVQVKHNPQPTSGRYKKKGKLQEIL